MDAGRPAARPRAGRGPQRPCFSGHAKPQARQKMQVIFKAGPAPGRYKGRTP